MQRYNRRRNRILVWIRRASICQSDRRVLSGDKSHGLREGLVMGHEAGGYVVDPGNQGLLRAGDKVVLLPHATCGVCPSCRQGRTNLCPWMKHLGFHLPGVFADCTAVESAQCVYQVPVDFPDDALPLVEPLSCVFHALSAVTPTLRRTAACAVFGGGPMGCLMTRALRRTWPNLAVTVIEPHPIRQEALAAMGLDAEVTRQFDGMPVGCSFVVSSCATAAFDAEQVTQHGGTVVLFAGFNRRDRYDQKEEARSRRVSFFEEVHRRELIVHEHDRLWSSDRIYVGSSGYTLDDVRVAVTELQNHYLQYAMVQNTIIEGLSSHEAMCRPTGEPYSFGDKMAMEALLLPRGLEDPTYGSFIARTCKVLIRLDPETEPA